MCAFLGKALFEVQWFSNRELLLPMDDTSFVQWKILKMGRVKLHRLFQGQEQQEV
jgi:hypothetical protein